MPVHPTKKRRRGKKTTASQNEPRAPRVDPGKARAFIAGLTGRKKKPKKR